MCSVEVNALQEYLSVHVQRGSEMGSLQSDGANWTSFLLSFLSGGPRTKVRRTSSIKHCLASAQMPHARKYHPHIKQVPPPHTQTIWFGTVVGSRIRRGELTFGASGQEPPVCSEAFVATCCNCLVCAPCLSDFCCRRHCMADVFLKNWCPKVMRVQFETHPCFCFFSGEGGAAGICLPHKENRGAERGAGNGRASMQLGSLMGSFIARLNLPW